MIILTSAGRRIQVICKICRTKRPP